MNNFFYFRENLMEKREIYFSSKLQVMGAGAIEKKERGKKVYRTRL